MKYCNRCGSSLATTNDAEEIKRSEKRFDGYLDGLFWITALGVAVTVGGMVALKKLQFSDSFIIAFLILSSTAFLVNFAMSLWVVLGILKTSKTAKALAESSIPTTSELEPSKAANVLQPAPSVTENTTRSFEPIYTEKRMRDEG